MKASDFYGGSLLTAQKLGSKVLKTRIIEVKPHTIEAKGKSPETRLHLLCEGVEEEVRLNVTNGRTLSKAFGDETDAWIDKHIEVYVADTVFMGKATKGIFVRPAVKTKK